MSEMLERLARAIAGQSEGKLDDRWRRKAAAGLRAIGLSDDAAVPEMVQRVASAISAAAQMPTQIPHKFSCQCGHCIAFRIQARSGIAAMREPTDLMIAALDTLPYTADHAEAADYYRAMIDAALAE